MLHPLHLVSIVQVPKSWRQLTDWLFALSKAWWRDEILSTNHNLWIENQSNLSESCYWSFVIYLLFTTCQPLGNSPGWNFCCWMSFLVRKKDSRSHAGGKNHNTPTTNSFSKEYWNEHVVWLHPWNKTHCTSRLRPPHPGWYPSKCSKNALDLVSVYTLSTEIARTDAHSVYE